ncbi:MAG: GNAT family N-acetyltransferase [Actinomycetota bacterium]|jgi:GNAT superfamily N-acetyltransferase|nr:GNAT family N-acetyltransferase [Rubrobacter sp.]MBA3789694.1 GNAT family N-acetyltransferase [Rubrobacter sp.]MDQ3566711.1 GNAT family N-acetyltransferase [Actinomycetota bacterium]
MPEFSIRNATGEDVPLILSFIHELAEYEKLSHKVSATEEILRNSLFGERPVAEVLIGESDGRPAAFALFFHNFSTFLGRPGIYLEDLYVRPEFRGQGIGKAMFSRLARLAKERGCGRLEWSVLDWNEDAIRFYKKLGAVPMDEWTTLQVTGAELDGLAAGGSKDG